MDRNRLEATPAQQPHAEAVPSFRAPLLWLGLSGASWAAVIGSIYWFLG